MRPPRAESRSDLGSEDDASERGSALGGAPRGAREPARRSKLLTVCPFILGNEFCERLAFYGLSTNLVIYLTRVMGVDPGAAAVQVNLFEGTCYLTPLLGAWLADARLGRYRTILLFSWVYLAGMVGLVASAAVPGLTPPPDEYPARYQSAALYGALYVIALGTGGIKPNVSAFGADQFDDADPRDAADKASFFNWFYFFINIGSLVAVTLIVWVQEDVSWALGFAVPAAAMAAAIAVFLAGARRYRHVPPTKESPLARCVNVARAAWAERRRRARGAGGAGADGDLARPLLPPDGGGGVRRSASAQWLDAAVGARPPGGGGAARPAFTAAQVDEVKLVARMLPVFATTLLYWTVYMQMGSFFVVQGAAMDRALPLPGGRAFVVPAASLSMLNTVSIVALIPVYDRLLLPAAARAGVAVTPLRRIGAGLAVAAAAMAAAAGVEAARLARAAAGAPPLPAWWQAPQYLLVGLSEVLASIGQIEFFYDQAPDVMRSCSSALQLLSVAVGSYLSGGLVAGVAAATRWLPKRLDDGRLDLFFLLLAGVMAADAAAFVWVASRYAYKEVPHAARAPAGAAPRPPAPPAPPLGASPPRAGARAPALPTVVPGRGARRAAADEYGRSLAMLPATPALPAPFK